VVVLTARRYRLQNPHDAKAAIDVGARYLRDLLVRFGGRLDLALAAYNAGEGTVESFQRGRQIRLTNQSSATCYRRTSKPAIT